MAGMKTDMGGSAAVLGREANHYYYYDYHH
jgi:hypothetical protein